MRNSTNIDLLGIKGSGKSTVIKQMHSIYSNGFSEEERHKSRPVILKYLLGIFKTLLSNMDTERMSFGTETAKLSVDLIAKTDADAVFSGAPVDAAICDAMKNVWLDPVMVSGFQDRFWMAMLKVPPTSFYNSTDRLTTPEWLPNEQDTLQARIRSLGVTEISFNIGPITWEMVKIDNCGAGVREKGLHHFEDVHCVLYVVPLSDYDQRLIEDDSATMMHEIILAFESSIYYNRWFKDKPLVIFLNKVDIFKEKLAISPLSEYFLILRVRIRTSRLLQAILLIVSEHRQPPERRSVKFIHISQMPPTQHQ
ncbi:hypothetical protein N7481_006238 [Penicillium waksmanii]|uniref:uncharacterized protein n=1 Tax=Penicillium waksmanii TaxID=69791 RepID=UPI0025481C94|nr:uncharacterized protein N7481_006238 [Penicillium waksmanii]KAJ5984139.1 hypothetical protein N7481_006238 [Penicillium waksmanii]